MMNILKKLPVSYMGELHNVKLINFSVEKEELRPLVPASINIRNWNGRALISMVNVKLKKMRPVFTSAITGFDYQHVAFRVLIEDAHYTGNGHKGIFFAQSFTDTAWIATLGNQLTNYRLGTASIREIEPIFELKQGDKFVHYAFENHRPENINPALKTAVAALDRAYAVIGNQLHTTTVTRKHWPIEWIDCYHFETNFFETARLEGAFCIQEVIDYIWNAPRAVNHCMAAGQMNHPQAAAIQLTNG